MSSNIRVQRICDYCKTEFTAKTTVTKYCSKSCNKKSYKKRIKDEKINSSKSKIFQVKVQPFEELKIKPYLSITETSKLIGISRRTLYRMIQRGDLNVAKIGSRTIIRRSDIENLFESPQPSLPISQSFEYKISDCYTIGEVIKKYGVSEKALFEIIKRSNVPKLKKGWYTYVPKFKIDNILS